MRLRPLPIPVQTLRVRDAGRDLDVRPAENLLHRDFNSVYISIPPPSPQSLDD